MNELPAPPLPAGVFWTWIVPTVLFVIALAATWLLYRHFANQPPEDDS